MLTLLCFELSVTMHREEQLPYEAGWNGTSMFLRLITKPNKLQVSAKLSLKACGYCSWSAIMEQS